MPRHDFSWNQQQNNGSPLNSRNEDHISDVILKRNVDWFVNLRWLVIFGMVTAQFSAFYFQGLLKFLGLHVSGIWAAMIAVILLYENVFVILYNRYSRSRFNTPSNILWFQIIVDLISLTFVIHYLGSITTPAPFLYLLHIALSCVFFSKRASFKVAIIASIFFLACVSVEYGGLHQPSSILASYINTPNVNYRFNVLLLSVSIIALYFSVWYVISKLSNIIRLHEKQIMAAEEEARAAQREKEQYIVFMTHQLKSPLDSLRSNIALINGGYHGEVSAEIQSVLRDADLKAENMGSLILDVLKLNTLKKENDEKADQVVTDLKPIVMKCIEELQPIIIKKNIHCQMDLESLSVTCNPIQIHMLFNNLIANAINYSHESGNIRISGMRNSQGESVIVVADSGIGIDPAKLSHIFDEFFRTREAVKHNRQSTGIGLSIVKHVAQKHKIDISVESEPGNGTSFTLRFPGY